MLEKLTDNYWRLIGSSVIAVLGLCVGIVGIVLSLRTAQSLVETKLAVVEPILMLKRLERAYTKTRLELDAFLAAEFPSVDAQSVHFQRIKLLQGEALDALTAYTSAQKDVSTTDEKLYAILPEAISSIDRIATLKDAQAPASRINEAVSNLDLLEESKMFPAFQQLLDKAGETLQHKYTTAEKGTNIALVLFVVVLFMNMGICAMTGSIVIHARRDQKPKDVTI